MADPPRIPPSSAAATAPKSETPPAGDDPLWKSFAQLMRLTNQSGTLLLMLPTLWALVLAARGRPSPALLLIFAVGSFTMRSAGVVMNDLVDRAVDRQVARTRSRPLARGAVTPRQALLTVMALLAVAATLVLFLDRLAIMLSPVAVLLAALYPFSKRVFPLPQAMLGIAFGWGVIMAWAATTNSVPAGAWLLYGATICWAIAYDTIYALQDREDDLRIGIRSSAILFGSHTWMAVGIFLGIMLILLTMAGRLQGIHAGFYGAMAAVAGFFTQQVCALRQPIAPAHAFHLFRQHVWVGWTILIGIWIGFLDS